MIFMVGASDANENRWRWAALEVLRGESKTLRSDVWSFGVTWWEILSLGATPFESIGSSLYPHHLPATLNISRLHGSAVRGCGG